MNESGALLAEARRHHLTKVNDVLRRPGMYGRDEMAERLLLEAMAAVDGALEQWQAECEVLRERRAFTATGVMGAYGYVLPADAVRDATASVYAEIAHHLGWLHLDRALSEAEFQQLAAEVDEWVTRNRTLPEVVDRFGTPSLWTGPASSCHPKTLAYTTADPEQRLICFHLGNASANTEGTGPQDAYATVVLAVRHRPGDFLDAFSFTPAGIRRRPTTEQDGALLLTGRADVLPRTGGEGHVDGP